MRRFKGSYRRAFVILVAAGIAAASSLVTGTPAYAHSRSSAIQYGCGSSYNYVPNTQVSVVSRTSSVVYGYVALARKSSSGYCVVLWKRSGHSGHGVGTRMAVYQGTQRSRICTSCRHWESITFSLGNTVAFSYSGYINHPTPGYYAFGGGSWSIYD